MIVRNDVLRLGQARVAAKNSLTPWPLTENERHGIVRVSQATKSSDTKAAALPKAISPQLWQSAQPKPHSWRS